MTVMNDPRQGIASSVPPLQPTVRHAFVVQVAPGSPIAKQCVGVGAATPLKHHCPPAYARRAAQQANVLSGTKVSRISQGTVQSNKNTPLKYLKAPTRALNRWRT